MLIISKSFTDSVNKCLLLPLSVLRIWFTSLASTIPTDPRRQMAGMNWGEKTELTFTDAARDVADIKE